MARRSFRWFGKQVEADMRKASRIGVNITMSKAVESSKVSHPFRNRTGNAERSIRIESGAKKVGRFIEGVWGSVNNLYFTFLEFGTKRARAFPTLVPASERVYPTLNDAIASEYASLAVKRGARLR